MAVFSQVAQKQAHLRGGATRSSASAVQPAGVLLLAPANQAGPWHARQGWGWGTRHKQGSPAQLEEAQTIRSGLGGEWSDSAQWRQLSSPRDRINLLPGSDALQSCNGRGAASAELGSQGRVRRVCSAWWCVCAVRGCGAVNTDTARHLSFQPTPVTPISLHHLHPHHPQQASVPSTPLPPLQPTVSTHNNSTMVGRGCTERGGSALPFEDVPGGGCISAALPDACGLCDGTQPHPTQRSLHPSPRTPHPTHK